MTTLHDIAKAAGVTTATVSRALNNEPGVKEQTRNKITAIAKQMNYSFGKAAKQPGAKPGSIGVIWSPPVGLFFNHLCNELQRLASLRGQYVLVSFEPPAEAMRHLNDHLVEKIVFWCGTGWMPSLEFLQARQQFRGEMVVIGGGRLEEAHRLAVDRTDAVMKAVRHLAELGHERIAFVGATTEKLTGYTLGLLENKLAYDPEFFIQADRFELPEQQIARVLNKDNPARATAVIVDSHGILFPFIQTIRKLRLRVPDDFSLVVYESLPEMEQLLDVPITSVGPSYKELAERSIRVLLGEEPGAAEGEWHDGTVPCELTVRQSTAAVSG
ncbi:LacI family DNA-binding transcriptional regulator [Paenibacillus sp. GYB003]|uniref:LacI family DNA-binding transcriptional regulator n=1 Tax=Paenibacillus sp. GYB003 TaxID=2994392 RepID=UPI002F9672F4